MTFPRDWSTKIHFMPSLFGAVFTTLSEKDKSLVKAWFETKGYKCNEVHAKNWKDYPEGIRIFSKHSPTLAKELLEWTIEPLLIGNFSDKELDEYKETGVSFYFNKSIFKISELETEPYFDKKLNFTIFTKDFNFDHHLENILKSMGQAFSTEGNFEHLVQRLKLQSNHILILDWDNVPLPYPKTCEILKKLKQEKSFLLIGLKDFLKENLYNDLKAGISETSNLLIPKTELLETLLSSFPILSKENKRDSSKIQQKRIHFEFQEKTVPIGILLEEVPNQKDTSEEKKAKNILEMFDWLTKPQTNSLK